MYTNEKITKIFFVKLQFVNNIYNIMS